MKMGWRIALFAAGVGLLYFSWNKMHNEMLSLQNPGNTHAFGSEIFVVVGGFVMLMAFAPTPEMLGRWMSLKKRSKKTQPAHFKRRRQRG